MPIKTGSRWIWLLWTGAFLALIAGCRSHPENIPFPVAEKDYAQPATASFQFSQAQPLNWRYSAVDSLKSPTARRFDLNQIPATSIDMEDFKPLRSPLTESVMPWARLPDTIFNYSQLPTQRLIVRNFLVPAPRRIKADLPHSREDASTGILTFGEDQLTGTNAGTHVLRDRLGMIWLATSNTLYRYDGEYFDVYTIDAEENRIRISSLAEDQDGKIWIGTVDNGIYILDRHAGIVQRITNQTALNTAFIYGIYCDQTNRIWVATLGNGVFIVDQQAATLKGLGVSQGLSYQDAFSFLQDRSGRMWISTRSQVNIVDEKAGRLKRLGETEGLSSNLIEYFLEDRHGRIWISTDYQLNSYDPATGIIRHLGELQGLSSSQTNHLEEDAEGRIWIGTIENGLEVFDEKIGGIKHISTRQGLASPTIYSLTRDLDGQLWVGEERSNVNIIRLEEDNLLHLKLNPDQSKSATYGLIQDSLGKFWIESQNTLIILDPLTGANIKFGTPQGLHSTNITSLMADAQNRIWITTDEGLDLIDQKAGQIRHLSTEQGLSNDFVMTALEDRSGAIWIGNTGLQQINGKTGKVHRSALTRGLMNDSVFSLLQDQSGQLWVGTIRGLYFINEKDATIKHVAGVANLNNNLITSMAEDSLGTVWVGCQRGLYAIDVKQNRLMHFGLKEGMADLFVRSVIIKGDRIYAGTSKGLTVIRRPRPSAAGEPGEWTVKTYGKAQGFRDVNFHVRSALKTSSGQLVWGFNDLLTVMDMREDDTLAPPVFITGISIDDKPRTFADKTGIERHWLQSDTIWSTDNSRPYTKNKFPSDSLFLGASDVTYDSASGPYNLPHQLRLPYNQNFLSFQFSGTHLANADKAHYRYILEGTDKSWSAITDKPFSENYRDLSPGKYTFKVASLGFNGRWSEPDVLHFVIRPPWWKTWWAYSIYAFLAAVSLWLFTYLRSQRLVAEKHELETKVNMRTAEVVRQKEEIAVQRDNLEQTLAELKNTQSQLVQSEKMASLGELTAGVAHEIQNPLNFVNNFSEVNLELIDEMKLEIDKGNGSAVKDLARDIQGNLEKVIHHGKRADAIVKGMLQHSRSSTGQKEPTDLNALADEYLRLSFHGLRAKDKTFNSAMKTNFDPLVGLVNMIPQDVGRVLLNLYNNAFYSVMLKKKELGVNFSPLVQVSTKKIRDKVEIRVRDNGLGISQKVVDKIYQPFFTTKPTGQGTGLGLSLSYDIITKQHEGSLVVDTREGEYAEFIILLPRD